MELFLSHLIVLELRVEDRGDEGRGGPAADSGPGLGSGVVLGLIVAMELVWGAATNGGTTLDKWALIARSDIYVRGNTVWSQIAQLLLFS